MIRRILSILFIIVLSVTLICGCQSKDAIEDKAFENSENSNQSTKDGNSITVILNSIGNTLDPPTANSTNTNSIMNDVYDDLVGLDKNFDFEPAIASEWNQVDDLTWVLTIIDGVKFHNGEALTLEDIVYSIERLRDIPQAVSSVENLDSVTILEDNKIELKLKKKHSSSFRDIIASVVIVNKAYVESAGAEASIKPIGTGPYRVEDYVPGDKVILRAWDDYPFEKPMIDKITFKAIEEATSRYIAVETGEADMARIAYQDVNRAEENSNLNVHKIKTTNTGFISMNTTKPPFDNVNIRRALAYATNRDGLAIIRGGAIPITSLTTDILDTHISTGKLPEYDMKKAEELLNKEGYGKDNPLVFEAWIYKGSDPVLEAYQAELKSIGVEMSISSLEFGVFLDGVMNKEYQLLLGSWNNNSGNKLTSLENYWTGSFGNSNISFYNNPKCDELYNKAVVASSHEELIGYCKSMQEIVDYDVPMIPTFSEIDYKAINKRLVGVELHPGGSFSLRNASIK